MHLYSTETWARLRGHPLELLRNFIHRPSYETHCSSIWSVGNLVTRAPAVRGHYTTHGKHVRRNAEPALAVLSQVGPFFFTESAMITVQKQEQQAARTSERKVLETHTPLYFIQLLHILQTRNMQTKHVVECYDLWFH